MEGLACVMFLVFSVCQTSSFSGFLKQPTDEKQAEGELAYFNCIIKRLDNTEYVSWLHNGHKISEDDRIIDRRNIDRYSIDYDPDVRKYNLQIQNVQRRDSGEYTCTIYNSGGIIVAESKSANFTVLQIPREHYPICSPIAARYSRGQAIIISCISENIEPPVRLKWKRNSVDITSGIDRKMTDDNHVVNYSFLAKKSDNRAMFICELTTSANPSIRRNCSCGPINIIYAPVVRIKQTGNIVLDKEAIFICYSDANPEEERFEWIFNPPIDRNMYLLENDRILRITDMKRILNNTKVMCQVTNSMGIGSSVLYINIKSQVSSEESKADYVDTTKSENKDRPKDKKSIPNHQLLITTSPDQQKNTTHISISLIVAIAVASIVVILGLAMIPVGYMRYTRRQPSDTVSRGRPVSIPDVYFEPKDHVDPMLPQLGLSAPWMRTVGVQVPGECEYDMTYTQISPQSRQAYYSQRMYTAASM
ncbi:cell adhesion molecule 2-like [Anneissia japonica]|uniref:cell adhesion molecule 2-like n=1 Tax=Anneissia japonica TaxID=1529436 RepID=UPI001425874D|nr:cell adhesion molecule 2-like [Anneissia japonica]